MDYGYRYRMWAQSLAMAGIFLEPSLQISLSRTFILDREI